MYLQLFDYVFGATTVLEEEVYGVIDTDVYVNVGATPAVFVLTDSTDIAVPSVGAEPTLVTFGTVNAVPSVVADPALHAEIYVAVFFAVFVIVAVGVPNVNTPSEMVADGIALLIASTP